MSKQKSELLPPPLHINRCVDALAAQYMRDTGGARALIVCDTHTHNALGERLAHALKTDIHTFPGGLKASIAAARTVAEHAQDRPLIAIGAGTINDICKYAAGIQGKPYACFPTALSMNGYASAGASLTTAHGTKASLPCPPPAAIYFCPDVSAAAPPRLLRAGLCDTLCYVSCLNDLELRRIFTGIPYDDAPFALQRPFIESIVACDNIHTPDITAVMRLLIASGHGMRIAGSSAPASQSEHMLCHAYDTAFPCNSYLHGEKTGMFARYTLALQGRIFRGLANGAISAHSFPRRYRAALKRALPTAARVYVSGRDALSVYQAKTSIFIDSDRHRIIAKTQHLTEANARTALLSLAPPRLPRLSERVISPGICLTRDRFTCLDIAASYPSI